MQPHPLDDAYSWVHARDGHRRDWKLPVDLAKFGIEMLLDATRKMSVAQCDMIQTGMWNNELVKKSMLRVVGRKQLERRRS